MRFRCTLCGGAGVLDDTDVFSTYDVAPPEADEASEDQDPQDEDQDPEDDEDRAFLPRRPSGLDAALDTF